MWTLLRPALYGFAALAGFTAAASGLLLWLTGQWHSYPDLWPCAWWRFVWLYPGNTPVLVSGGAPLALIGLIGSRMIAQATRKVHAPLKLTRPPGRDPPAPLVADTDSHGHARFSTIKENQERWPGGALGYVGTVVGEADDPREDDGWFNPRKASTWGRGGTAPLLIDDLTVGSTHSIDFGGSGSGKTLGVVIPNLLTFRGPVVCVDPKQNLADRLKEAREAMGKKVVVLEPGKAGFHAVDWIDPQSDLFGIDIDNVIEDVCGHTSRRDQKAAFFKDRGKDIAKALLADMLWDTRLPSSLRSLDRLRQQLSKPADELADILRGVYKNSASPIARDHAGSLASDLDKSPEMFAGFHSAVVRDTAWLGDPAYSKLVSGDAFRTTDILNGDTDVFIALPLKALEANSAPARCILGALMNAVYDAKGNFPAGRVLFEIEEAKRIGRMNILGLARDAGREFGITLNLIYQSPAQMETDWGRDGKQAWYDNARRSYSAVNSTETAAEVEEALGEYGVVNLSASQNTGTNRGQRRSRSWGRSITHSWGRRKRMLRQEIMYDLRSDTKIVIPQPGTGWPAICRTAFAPRRPEWRALVKDLY